jgi:hypothetical protein
VHKYTKHTSYFYSQDDHCNQRRPRRTGMLIKL